MDKPIQPFEFLTEDQIKVELEKIEAEKKAMLAKQKQTEVKVVANVPKAKINNGHFRNCNGHTSGCSDFCHCKQLVFTAKLRTERRRISLFRRKLIRSGQQ